MRSLAGKRGTGTRTSEKGNKTRSARRGRDSIKQEEEEKGRMALQVKLVQIVYSDESLPALAALKVGETEGLVAKIKLDAVSEKEEGGVALLWREKEFCLKLAKEDVEIKSKVRRYEGLTQVVPCTISRKYIRLLRQFAPRNTWIVPTR